MNWLKAYFAAERKKIAHLNREDKLRYIWQYYYLWIIGIVCAVLFTGYVVYHYMTAVTEQGFYITLVNTREQVGNGSELYQGFVEYSGIDPKEKIVEFNDNSYFQYTEGRAMGNTYYNQFVAMTDAGTLDAVVMDPVELTALGASGRLLDLDRDECASIKAKYGDRFLYCVPYDEEYAGQEIAVAIEVSDSALITKYRLYPEKTCAIAIGAQTQHIEAVEQFLDYIFEEAE